MLSNIPKDNGDKVKYYLRLFDEMHSEKSEVMNIVKDVDKYVIGKTVEYDSSNNMDKQKFDFVYDQTALNAMRQSTSALNGMLWKKNGIKIVRSENLPDTAEIKDFYQKATDKFLEVLDNPTSRFSLVFHQSLLDDFPRSATGIGVYKGDKSPLIFKNHLFKNIFFQEDYNGEPNIIAYRIWMPVYKVVEKYGEEEVGTEIMKLYKDESSRSSKVEVIQVIHPNNGEDAKEKPYLSIHIARDQNHILKDSFYEEKQIIISRFWKDSDNPYGTSPVMDNIITVKRLNSLTSDLFDGTSRTVISPFAYDVNAFQGKSINLSSGAANPYDSSGIEGGSIFTPLSNVGDLSVGKMMQQELREAIIQAYFVDRLIDIKIETQMTATEFTGRETIRASSLNSLLERQIVEKMTPLFESSFNLLFKDNFFGFVQGSESESIKMTESALLQELSPVIDNIPDDIVKAMEKGEPIYKIVYTTPAHRLLQAQELQNTETVYNLLGKIMTVYPQGIDKVNVDKSIDSLFENTGLEDQLNSDDFVEDIRNKRLQAQQREAEANVRTQEAEAESIERS